MKTAIAKPFIKWAGGKTQLLPEIEKSLPQDFAGGDCDTYIEPFVGGGAVLFWILQRFPHIKKAVISDVNAKLITTYRVIKERPHDLIARLEILQNEYSGLTDDDKQRYYLTQRAVFNSPDLPDIETSSLFIFLNRTCFNGLYRVNSKGEFNVPFGKYTNPTICDRDNILACSELLQKTDILCCDFTETARFISPKALFYFDPPYKPISKTSSFTSYTKEQFKDEDQIRLSDFCTHIANAKALFILSSSDVNTADSQNDFFDRLYARFRIRRVSASRMINANPQKRGKLSELIITNIQPMKRDFNEWLTHLRSSIADYKYYINFDKVFANVDSVKIELNILSSLIGSKDIENDFCTLTEKYPEVLKCIPILIAKREMEISATDEDGCICYDFDKRNHDIGQYKIFMRKTGLFELLSNRLIGSLTDYVTGVETGLDSNGRKNRGGHLMENLIENHLKNAGFERDKTYFKEMYIHEIEKKWNIDLSAISNAGEVEKRFDFVVKTPTTVYAIEANFYTSSGSKLNETARSYKTIALESKDIRGFKFLWITDGTGWNSARNNLKETFDILDNLYNIHDLENGILQEILK